MNDKMNETYLKIHNTRTMLDVVVGYLERDSDDDTGEIEKVLFALTTARNEARDAERLLGGSV